MPAEGVVRSILTLLIASAAFAANKPSPTPTVKTGNADVELTATLYVDKASIAQLLGSDMGGYYVVVNVRLAPKNNEKIKVFRDDFQLRTDRDGERSKPFAASQIAGRGALVVTRTYEGGGVAAENGGPVFGGGIGGMGVGGIGNSGSTISNSAKIDSGSKNKENPLLGVLKEKILAEKEIDEPLSGLLYFPMEPKQKIKDLELTYAGPGSKLMLRFR
jgi:hypothetical protein